MTLNENSSVITNNTQALWEYPHHQKKLLGNTGIRTQHVTKTTTVFLPTDRKASWSLLSSLWSLYQKAAHCNQKAPIPVFSRGQVRSEKAEKGEASTLMSANISVHLL